MTKAKWQETWDVVPTPIESSEYDGLISDRNYDATVTPPTAWEVDCLFQTITNDLAQAGNDLPREESMNGILAFAEAMHDYSQRDTPPTTKQFEDCLVKAAVEHLTGSMDDYGIPAQAIPELEDSLIAAVLQRYPVQARDEVIGSHTQTVAQPRRSVRERIDEARLPPDPAVLAAERTAKLKHVYADLSTRLCAELKDAFHFLYGYSGYGDALDDIERADKQLRTSLERGQKALDRPDSSASDTVRITDLKGIQRDMAALARAIGDIVDDPSCSERHGPNILKEWRSVKQSLGTLPGKPNRSKPSYIDLVSEMIDFIEKHRGQGAQL